MIKEINFSKRAVERIKKAALAITIPVFQEFSVESADRK